MKCSKINKKEGTISEQSKKKNENPEHVENRRKTSKTL